MSNADIETLQMRIAYQDDAIEQLSDLVYAQSRELERLDKRCQALESRVQALADGEDPEASDQTPPHY